MIQVTPTLAIDDGRGAQVYLQLAWFQLYYPHTALIGSGAPGAVPTA